MEHFLGPMQAHVKFMHEQRIMFRDSDSGNYAIEVTVERHLGRLDISVSHPGFAYFDSIPRLTCPMKGEHQRKFDSRVPKEDESIACSTSLDR